MILKTLKNFKDYPYPKFKKINNYLIKGPAPTVRDLIQLRKDNVTQIYDFRHKKTKGVFEFVTGKILGMKLVEAITCKLLGIKYKRMPFSFKNGPFPQEKDYQKVTNDIVENGKKGQKTLLHCNSGRHRTSQMVAYYVLTLGKTIDECKKIYPKTYNKRVQIALDKYLNKSEYFSRKKIDTKTRNPLKRILINRNNIIVDTLKNSYRDFQKLLNKDTK